MDVLIDQMLKKAEGEKEPFVIISFDVPSENKEWETEEKATEVRTKRQSVSTHLFTYGCIVQKSVYMIATGRARKAIEYIENVYSNADYSKDVSLKVIGTVFKETAIQILESFIKESMEKMWESLEVAEARIMNASEKPDTEKKAKNGKAKDDPEILLPKIKQELYAQMRTINSVKEKIEDLKTLNHPKTDSYDDELRALENKRREIFRRF
jgi:hypothetical protein